MITNVDPLVVSDDIPANSYSIQTVVDGETDVFSGQFIENDNFNNSLAFQKEIKNVIQNTIRKKFKKSYYNIDPKDTSSSYPYVNTPNIKLYHVKEFLLYIPNSDDYFLINYINGDTVVNNPENRKTGVTFYTVGAEPQFFEYTGTTLNGINTNSSASAPSINTYEFNFGFLDGDTTGLQITLNVNSGSYIIKLRVRDSDRSIIFQSINDVSFIFDAENIFGSLNLEIASSDLFPGLKIIRPLSITVLTDILNPSQYLPIILDDFIEGLFITSDDIRKDISHVSLFVYLSYKFKYSENMFIRQLISVIYKSVLNAIYHILGSRDIYTSNTGYSSLSEMDGFSMEIKMN